MAVGAQLIRSDPSLAVEHRLAHLHVELARAIGHYRPDVVACERVLFSSNARTAMGVGQAAGVALLAAAQAGVPVTSYSPNDVKLAVAGHGAADKDAVGRMVMAQLRLATAPRPADIADALAVALCHLGRSRLGTVAASRSWEAVIDANPHVRIAGGTDR